MSRVIRLLPKMCFGIFVYIQIFALHKMRCRKMANFVNWQIFSEKNLDNNKYLENAEEPNVKTLLQNLSRKKLIIAALSYISLKNLKFIREMEK